MRVVVAAALGGLFGWFAAPKTLPEWSAVLLVAVVIGLLVVSVADALED